MIVIGSPGVQAAMGIDLELANATAAYWNAKTPEEERAAYARMRAAGAPPAYGEKPDLRPFAEVFPAGNISHHFIGQAHGMGVYAKELRIPAGFTLGSHEHPYDHLSILASGFIVLTIDGESRTICGPAALTIAAGKTHSVRAVTEAVWFCIHPTDETDPEKVDDAILGQP